MEKAEPVKCFEEIGFGGAISLSVLEEIALRQKENKHINQIVTYAEEIGAIIKGDQEERVLVQSSDGNQYDFRIIVLRDVVSPG